MAGKRRGGRSPRQHKVTVCYICKKRTLCIMSKLFDGSAIWLCEPCGRKGAHKKR